MSNDTNYTIRVQGEKGKVEQLLKSLEEKQARYETWQEDNKGLAGKERSDALAKALKKHGLNSPADFVTWGFFVESRKNLKGKSEVVLGGWANENSSNCAISGESGELAAICRAFPELEYSVDYNDEYSRGTCTRPHFEKEESEESAATLDHLAVDLLCDGGNECLESCLETTTSGYKYLEEGVAERIHEINETVDLTGLEKVSAADAKALAKCTNVILSPAIQKIVERHKK